MAEWGFIFIMQSGLPRFCFHCIWTDFGLCLGFAMGGRFLNVRVWIRGTHGARMDLDFDLLQKSVLLAVFYRGDCFYDGFCNVVKHVGFVCAGRILLSITLDFGLAELLRSVFAFTDFHRILFLSSAIDVWFRIAHGPTRSTVVKCWLLE